MTTALDGSGPRGPDWAQAGPNRANAAITWPQSPVSSTTGAHGMPTTPARSSSTAPPLVARRTPQTSASVRLHHDQRSRPPHGQPSRPSPPRRPRLADEDLRPPPKLHISDPHRPTRATSACRKPPPRHLRQRARHHRSSGRRQRRRGDRMRGPGGAVARVCPRVAWGATREPLSLLAKRSS
jgi:hypothetical protein